MKEKELYYDKREINFPELARFINAPSDPELPNILNKMPDNRHQLKSNIIETAILSIDREMKDVFNVNQVPDMRAQPDK